MHGDAVLVIKSWRVTRVPRARLPASCSLLLGVLHTVWCLTAVCIIYPLHINFSLAIHLSIAPHETESIAAYGAATS